MDTVLFTDHQVLVFAITASAISLVLAVLLVSTGVEKRVDRLESKIRQILIHQ
jgi:diacylglycerol kinase